jgi:hypothetical protein
MRKVKQMPDFEGELFLFRDQRTTFWQVFQRIDRLNQPAKPPFCRFRLFPDIMDEMNVARSSALK